MEEALEDGSIRDIVIVHETGQAAKGFLSTNIGAGASVLGLLLILLAYPPTQALATNFIAFIRMQISGIARDIAAEFVPTPEQIVDEVAKAAKGTLDAARELFREIEFGALGPAPLPKPKDPLRPGIV